jgi:hypothetical protein
MQGGKVLRKVEITTSALFRGRHPGQDMPNFYFMPFILTLAAVKVGPGTGIEQVRAALSRSCK